MADETLSTADELQTVATHGGNTDETPFWERPWPRRFTIFAFIVLGARILLRVHQMSLVG